MCGIVGKIDFGRNAIEPELLGRMCAAMEHRGPDQRGIHTGDGVALGMQRLAIIDREGGDQPFYNEDGTVAVVFNGEIYNFPELREELIRRGHRLTSHSDTEVLAHLYEDHGADMARHLRGMFAFAIWDSRRRRLLLGRDRVGKKPLFWARRGDCIWFSSEMVPLMQDPKLDLEVDLRSVDAYMTLGYVPDPLAIFKGVNKLRPAHVLEVDVDGERATRYWQLDYREKLTAPVEDIEEQLRDLIREATRIRLMSEVPLGAFLSGGVDSSAIVAAMAEASSSPVKTFSIGFSDDNYNELPYAKTIAELFSTDHHEFRVEPEALSIMPTMARHYGEPFADPSAIPCFYLAELTSRHVTVALNGDGGDESFAGYRRYISNDMARHLNGIPRPMQRAAPSLARLLGEGKHASSTRSRVQRLARTLAMEPHERYAHWMCHFTAVARERVQTPAFRQAVADAKPERFISDAWIAAKADTRVDRMLAVDVETYLPGDLLVKIDIAAMAYSVEGRSPFLDHKLMEFAASIPAEMKLRGSSGKRILRSAVREWIPDEILDRPKMGFGVPLAEWFRGELRDLPREVLLDPQSIDRGLFVPAEIEQLISEHQDRRADHSNRIWNLLQLETWFREVADARPRAGDTQAVGSASP